MVNIIKSFDIFGDVTEMTDINTYKERLVIAEQAFSILHSDYRVNNRENPEIIAKLAEAGKYCSELRSLITFDEIKNIPNDKLATYLETKLKESKEEINRIKKMYDILKVDYNLNNRQDPDSISRFAEICQYDLSVRMYSEKLQDKLDENKGISAEDKKKKIDQRKQIVINEKKEAEKIYDNSRTTYDSMNREDSKSIAIMAEAGKYLNNLEMYIDDIEFQSTDGNDKEYLNKLYSKREKILQEKAFAKGMFQNIEAQYNSLNRFGDLYLGKISSVIEYRSDILERLEKVEDRILLNGGAIPEMSKDKINKVLLENEYEVQTVGKIYNDIEGRYKVNNRMDPVLLEKFTEVGSCLLTVEKKANRFKYKPANKDLSYNSNNNVDGIDSAEREKIRLTLVEQGEYIPSLEYLETASPKAYWFEAGLYGNKNPLAGEFQGVAKDKREQIIYERTKATMTRLDEQGFKSAVEHFNLKI